MLGMRSGDRKTASEGPVSGEAPSARGPDNRNFQKGKERECTWKRKREFQRTVGYRKCICNIMEITRGGRGRSNRRNIWNTNAENFSKLISPQIQEAEKTLRKNARNVLSSILYSKYRKLKTSSWRTLQGRPVEYSAQNPPSQEERVHYCQFILRNRADEKKMEWSIFKV